MDLTELLSFLYDPDWWRNPTWDCFDAHEIQVIADKAIRLFELAGLQLEPHNHEACAWLV